MENHLGYFGFILGFFITCILIYKKPRLASVLLVAYIFRWLFVVNHNYLIPFVEGMGDATNYEQLAWDLSKLSINERSHYRYGNGDIYSWVGAIFYSLLGRSIVFLQSIGVVAGVVCVFLVNNAVELLWGNRYSLRSAWIVALFPPLILYSALTMREIFIVAFMLYGIIGIIYWKTYNYKIGILKALIGFTCAGYLHAAFTTGLILTLILVVLEINNYILNKYLYNKYNKYNKLINVLILVTLLTICYDLLIHVSLPYLGSLNDLNVQHLISQQDIRLYGNTAYPDWLLTHNALQFFLLSPIRLIYFLGSPFFWDLKKLIHIIGMLDGIIYLYITWLICCNFNFIWKNYTARIIFILTIILIIEFTLGTINSGTALRHRAKFFSSLIIIISPLIPHIRSK